MLLFLVVTIIVALILLGLVVAIGFSRRNGGNRNESRSNFGRGAPCQQPQDLMLYPYQGDGPLGAAPDVDFSMGDSRDMEILPQTVLPNAGFEAETNCAADNAHAGTRYLATVSDFAVRGGFNTTLYSYTVDGGKTWTRNFVPYDNVTSRLLTGDARDWAANSDPVVAYSSDGVSAYFCSLYFNVADSANGLYVGSAPAPSTAGVNVFGNRNNIHAVAVNTSPTATQFEDKPWLSAAPDQAKTLYVSWTRFTASTAFIVMSKSTDGGLTWSLPTQVSDTIYNGAVQGSQIVAGKNGRVFIIYMVAYISGFRAQVLTQSSDGGKTFSKAGTRITPVYLGLNFTSTYRKESFASAAYNSTSQVLHIAFAGTSNVGRARVYYVRVPVNNAASTSSPVSVIQPSNAGGNQMMPAIGSSNNGVVAISWYDTRLGVNNQFLDCFATKSKNDGLSWSPPSANLRLSSSTVNVDSTPFIGDYSGACVSNDGRALSAFSFLLGPSMQTVFF